MGTRDKVTNFRRKGDMVREVLKSKNTLVQAEVTNYSSNKGMPPIFYAAFNFRAVLSKAWP